MPEPWTDGVSSGMSVDAGLSSFRTLDLIDKSEADFCTSSRGPFRLVFANVNFSEPSSADRTPSVPPPSSCPAPDREITLSSTLSSYSAKLSPALPVTPACWPWWLRALEWLSPESELMGLVLHAALLQAIIGRQREFVARLLQCSSREGASVE